jgi:hypothetical protein
LFFHFDFSTASFDGHSTDDEKLKSLKAELDQKIFELAMKDLEIDSQQKKIDCLLLKVNHLANQKLSNSDFLKIELQQEIIEKQEKELKLQKEIIEKQEMDLKLQKDQNEELKNEIIRLDKKLATRGSDPLKQEMEEIIIIDEEEAPLQHSDIQILDSNKEKDYSNKEKDYSNTKQLSYSSEDPISLTDDNFAQNNSVIKEKKTTLLQWGEFIQDQEANQAWRIRSEHKQTKFNDTCEKTLENNRHDQMDKNASQNKDSSQTLIEQSQPQRMENDVDSIEEYIEEDISEMKTENKFRQYIKITKIHSSTNEDHISINAPIKKVNLKNNSAKKRTPIDCSICSLTAANTYQLMIHVDTVHRKLDPIKCQICSKVFGYQAHLNSHVNAVHNKLKPFNCQMCPKRYKCVSALKQHVMQVHDKIKRRKK